MYHIKRVLSLRARLITAAVLLAVLVLAALGLMLGSRQVGRDLDTASAQALRQAVLQAAVQCYAVEGSYPASLDLSLIHILRMLANSHSTQAQKSPLWVQLPAS